MDWFQSKAAQIIGLVSIIGTLAGFGYTGATYVNRIENLESKVVAVDEQIKSLNIETQDLSPIKNDIIMLQTSVAGINSSIDSMYDDVQSLKNKNDNPLAN